MVGEMQTHQCYGDTVAQKHERLGRIRGRDRVSFFISAMFTKPDRKYSVFREEV